MKTTTKDQKAEGDCSPASCSRCDVCGKPAEANITFLIAVGECDHCGAIYNDWTCKFESRENAEDKERQ